MAGPPKVGGMPGTDNVGESMTGGRLRRGQELRKNPEKAEM